MNFIHKSKIINLITVLFFIFFFIRLLIYVKLYAVNLLYSDQWDFYNTIFFQESYLKTFLYEHAPPRLGIGLVIDRFILENHNLDTRLSSYLIVIFYFLSSLLALLIKNQIFKKKYSYINFIIPILFMSSGFFETMILVPNFSHGALPVFLLLSFLYIGLSDYSYKIKIYLFLILNFLSIYTAFTIFIGIIIPFFFIYNSIIYRDNQKISLQFIWGGIISILSFISFFYDYVFSSASSCFKFPHPKISEYFDFIIYFFSYFFGDPNNYILGINFSIILIITLLYSIVKGTYLARMGLKFSFNFYYLIFILTSFISLFIFNASIGRVCYGIYAGQTSRYLPYATPAVFSITLLILKINIFNNRIKFLLGIVLLIYLLKVELLDKNNILILSVNKKLKEDWIQCYLNTKDIENCQSTYKVFPDEREITQKLIILQKYKWNFFNQ